MNGFIPLSLQEQKLSTAYNQGKSESVLLVFHSLASHFWKKGGEGRSFLSADWPVGDLRPDLSFFGTNHWTGGPAPDSLIYEPFPWLSAEQNAACKSLCPVIESSIILLQSFSAAVHVNTRLRWVSAAQTYLKNKARSPRGFPSSVKFGGEISQCSSVFWMTAQL